MTVRKCWRAVAPKASQFGYLMGTRSIEIQQPVIDKFGRDPIFACLDCISAHVPKSALQLVLPDSVHSLNAPWFLHLADTLRRLSQCVGFDAALDGFNHDVQATLFALGVAGYLHERSDDIVLEPEIPQTGRRADVCARIGTDKFIFECKSPQFFEAQPDLHRCAQLNSIARGLIPPGHQLHFLFRKDPGDAAFVNVFSGIGALLESYSPSDTIFQNEWLTVRVESPQGVDGSAPPLIMSLMLYGHSTNDLYPGFAFCEHGYTLAFCGPLTNLTKAICKKLKRSAKQYDPRYPFISVMNSEGIYGERHVNFKSVEKELTPEINRRVSAVCFFETHLGAKGIMRRADWVTNPYARMPVDRSLFCSLAEDA